MSQSIITRKWLNRLSSSKWIITGINWHKNDSGKIIAFSIYFHNSKFLKTYGWLYVHNSDKILNYSRNHQLSLTPVFSNYSQAFFVDMGDLEMSRLTSSKVQINIKNIIIEDHKIDIPLIFHIEKDDINQQIIFCKNFIDINCQLYSYNYKNTALFLN